MAAHMATTQNVTPLGENTAQQKTPPAILTRRLVTGSKSVGSLTRPRMPTKNKSQTQYPHGGRKRADEVGVLEGDPAFDEVMIHALLANQKRPEDPKQITLTDISIDAMTEATATVDMPVASKKRASLQCKVDTDTGGNVMLLQAFAKLFPNWLMKTRMPTRL